MKRTEKAKQAEKLIIQSAFKAAKTEGLLYLSRDMICKISGMAWGNVSYYFKDLNTLKEVVAQYAIEKKHLKIIAHAIILEIPCALELPQKLKKSALLSLL